MGSTLSVGSGSRKMWVWLSIAFAAAFIILTVPILLGANWPGEWAFVQESLSMRSSAWTQVMQAVTFFGSAAVGLGMCVGLSTALLVRHRRLSPLVLLPLIAMLGSAPINLGLRAAIGRYRPSVAYIPHQLPEIAHPFQRWSYPAGHTMTAVICYGVLAYVATRAYPRARWAVLGAFCLGLTILSFSRVYLGVHWPTDVLGGCLAGGSWLAVCIALLGR